MAKVTVELPSMLSTLLDGLRRFEAEGDTLAAALDDAFRRQPKLKVHVVDETGAFRQHVLCFLNDENTRWFDDLEQALQDGDRITILQAVSGG